MRVRVRAALGVRVERDSSGPPCAANRDMPTDERFSGPAQALDSAAALMGRKGSFFFPA